MNKVVVITGPTAVGKTDLSLYLARTLGGEIVSADSMQIYRGMDIGTAKPTPEERNQISHHLIDIISPSETFSAGDFQKKARTKISEIIRRGKIPFVVGGTGFYIEALLYGLPPSFDLKDEKTRENLRKTAEKKGRPYLHNKLKEVDPKSAGRIHPNDLQRVVRALEVYKITGKPLSELHKEKPKEKLPYPVTGFILYKERGKLYQDINSRVDKMIEMGLVDEVKKLVNYGCTLKDTSMQGLGYKELYYYFQGLVTLDEATTLLKRNTRQYAKRQLTWFKNKFDFPWIELKKSSRLYLQIKKDLEKKLGLL